MQPALVDAIGFLAGVLTTIAFIPQVVHSWQTRDLAGVSLRMYALFTVGVAMWLLYGIAMGSWPIIAANTITLVLAGTVLVLKLIHR
jgi:MtN3 and saliva related transmembrane protein